MPVSPHTHEPDESWFDLEEHLNWPHNHRLNDLIGMSQQEKQSLHRRDHTEAVTHEYPTKKVKGTDLDETMTLVGESGGLSSIYEAEPSNIAFGMLNITTEHGPLFLDPDEEYDVLDAAPTDDSHSVYALVTTQGTAMPETALCDDHVGPAERAVALRNASQSEDWDKQGMFADCTDNTELRCIICGRGSTFNDTTKWVVETYEDGSVEWWSNEHGWVGDRNLATEFTTNERHAFDLPLDGNWAEVDTQEGTGV